MKDDPPRRPKHVVAVDGGGGKGNRNNNNNNNNEADDIGKEGKLGFNWTVEHMMLLNILSFHAVQEEHGDVERWVRYVPFLVMVFECLISGLMDLDYAPELVTVAEDDSHRGVWLNVSQEAVAMLHELIAKGLVRTLRAFTPSFQPTLCLQLSLLGKAVLDRVPSGMFEDSKHVLYAPTELTGWTFSDLLHVRWDGHAFHLHGKGSGYSRASFITTMEDVSYAISPYLPTHLRPPGPKKKMSSNRHQAHRVLTAGSTIRAMSELKHLLYLSEVTVLMVEWIPGEAVTRSTTIERASGPVVIAQTAPSTSSFALEANAIFMTQFDPTLKTAFNCQVEREVSTEELLQIRSYGGHMNTVGHTVFGACIDAIMHDISVVNVDDLSRMYLDLQNDSSKMFNEILTLEQKQMLQFLHYNDLHRFKFRCFLAERVEPNLDASKYLDKGDYENELAQLIGPISDAIPLHNGHFVLRGRDGMLVAGEHSQTLIQWLVPHLLIMAMSYCASLISSKQVSLFLRFNRLNERVLCPSRLSYVGMPEVVDEIMNITRDIFTIDLLTHQLQTSAAAIKMPPEPSNALKESMHACLELTDDYSRLLKRIKDLKFVSTGLLRTMKSMDNLQKTIKRDMIAVPGRGIKQHSHSYTEKRTAQRRNGLKDWFFVKLFLVAILALHVIDRMNTWWLRCPPPSHLLTWAATEGILALWGITVSVAILSALVTWKIHNKRGNWIAGDVMYFQFKPNKKTKKAAKQQIVQAQVQEETEEERLEKKQQMRWNQFLSARDQGKLFPTKPPSTGVNRSPRPASRESVAATRPASREKATLLSDNVMTIDDDEGEGAREPEYDSMGRRMFRPKKKRVAFVAFPPPATVYRRRELLRRWAVPTLSNNADQIHSSKKDQIRPPPSTDLPFPGLLVGSTLITGKMETRAGREVRILANGTLLGKCGVDEDGSWHCPLTYPLRLNDNVEIRQENCLPVFHCVDVASNELLGFTMDNLDEQREIAARKPKNKVLHGRGRRLLEQLQQQARQF